MNKATYHANICKNAAVKSINVNNAYFWGYGICMKCADLVMESFSDSM